MREHVRFKDSSIYTDTSSRYSEYRLARVACMSVLAHVTSVNTRFEGRFRLAHGSLSIDITQRARIGRIVCII